MARKGGKPPRYAALRKTLKEVGMLLPKKELIQVE